MRDAVVERVPGAARRTIPPNAVDHALRRHDLIGLQEQKEEQCSFPRGGRRDDFGLAPEHLEGARTRYSSSADHPPRAARKARVSEPKDSCRRPRACESTGGTALDLGGARPFLGSAAITPSTRERAAKSADASATTSTACTPCFGAGLSHAGAPPGRAGTRPAFARCARGSAGAEIRCRSSTRHFLLS
jgi:hypothetical protein